MKLENFIQSFAEQFEETPNENFAADTDFKALEEWESMTVLIIIAMADEEYNVTINGEDIRNADTIEDLFEIVKSRV